MLDRLIDTSKTVTKPASWKDAVKDLEVDKIISTLTISGEDEQYDGDAIVRFLTADPDEINQRSAILEDFVQMAEIEERLTKSIEGITRLQYMMERSQTSSEDIYRLIAAWHGAVQYKTCVTMLRDKLLGRDEFTSPRLLNLKRQITALSQSSDFQSDARLLEAAKEWFRLPKDVYVGFNYVSGSGLDSIQVAAVDEEAAPIESLIRDTSHGQAQPNSLEGLVPFPVLSQSAQLESYLIKQIGKRWSKKLARLKKELEKLALSDCQGLIALNEDFKFLRMGLRLIQAAKQKGCCLCRPAIGSGPLQISQLMYPRLTLISEEPVVENDVSMEYGSFAMITGANHSGKTSYLKSVGQACILAQLGFFVPAASMRFTPVKTMFTLFSGEEDEELRYSRMGLEVQRIHTILQEADSESVVFFNEPLTSTNPIEAISLCVEWIVHFINNGITGFMVTHMHDIYFSLEQTLSDEKKRKFRSLVTITHRDDAHVLKNLYRVVEQEPSKTSYAADVADSFGISLEKLIENPALREQAQRYQKDVSERSLFE